LHKQLLPEPGSKMMFIFYIFEAFFVAIFSIEIFIKMYSYFPIKFWISGWNLFDFLII